MRAWRVQSVALTARDSHKDSGCGAPAPAAGIETPR